MVFHAVFFLGGCLIEQGFLLGLSNWGSVSCTVYVNVHICVYI